MSENPYHSPEHFGGRPRHKRGARVWLAVLGAIAAVGLLIALLLPFLGSARSAARLNACTRNLKQIALALHNYEAAYHALPPAYTVDANGKPLHSWRTLILPFLDERPLYDEIDLSKPWDDPVNVGAWNISIGAYNCPALQGPTNQTTYLAVVATDGCFRRTEPRQLSEITDNPAQTLMIIEAPAERAVMWMSPVDADEPVVLGFGHGASLPHAGGTNAVFVDGSVRFLDAELPAAQRRAMISIAGHDDTAGDSE